MTVSNTTESRRYRRRRQLLLAALLGVVAALVICGIVGFYLLRDTTPPLTAQALAEAERTWAAQGTGDYDMVVHIAGRRAGEVHISVRHGVPVAMTRDGITPSQQRTWDAWTVASLFDTLHTELAAAADPEHGYGAPSGSTASLRARFDPGRGYPAQFERQVLGTELEMGWEVIEFRPAP